MNSEAERQQIRRTMRQRRRDLAPRERGHLARALARQVASSALFRQARHIAFYFANDGELDPAPLMAIARSMGKHCYLPVLSPIFHNKVWFAPYEPGDPLRHNRFNIPEPDLHWRGMRKTWALDLVLTPLVAFDVSGNRLGMGGGFYDRTLAYLNRHARWHKPRLMGVAYEFQKVASLPRQAWDVPLSYVASERTIYRFS